MSDAKKLSGGLNSFSQWIQVSKKDIKRARRVGHLVYNWMQQDSKFRIDRIRYGGSFAKETSTLLKLDVDVAIYVQFEGKMETDKDIYDFLERVREDWKRVLMCHTNLTKEDLSKGKFAIKFTLQKFQFDLVPAINFSRDPYEEIRMNIYKDLCTRNSHTPRNSPQYPNSNYNPHKEIRPGEKSKVLDIAKVYLISVRPANIHYSKTENFMPVLKQALSPSSAEAAVQFVKEQSEYIKSLIRICKFWQQSVAYFEFKSGRSFLFECIAVR